jgi:ketosteroid isomerase-like protein
VTAPAPAVEVVRAIYAAMGARDLDGILRHLDPAFVVTQDERLPWGGRFEGHDGFATFAINLAGTIDSAVTHEALFEADGEVVQVGRTKGTVRASGVAFDVPEVHRWTVRDGRAVAAHFAIDTPAMLVALGGPG